MKLLFITPPMGNWAPWGDRHLAVNPLHAQLAAFVREKNAAEVEVLDCRALELDDEQMVDEVLRRKPAAVFFGALIAAAGGAAQLNRFHEAMKKIKDAAPRIVTIGGGLMYTAVPQQIMTENPQLDFATVGVFGDNEEALVELLTELQKPSPNIANVRGLAYRNGSEVILTPQRPLVSNLDALPMPAYDLFPMDRYSGYSVITIHWKKIVGRHRQRIEIGDQRSLRREYDFAAVSVCESTHIGDIGGWLLKLRQQLNQGLFVISENSNGRKIELRILGHDLLRNGGVHQAAADGHDPGSGVFDFFHRLMEAVQLSRSARGRDQRAEENRIRFPSQDFVDHLLIA